MGKSNPKRSGFEISHSESVEDISQQEAQFTILFSSLLIELTGKQRSVHAEILLLAGNASNQELSIFRKTRLPTTVEDFDLFYLKWNDSFMQNLPIPVVQSTPDMVNSYVSLADLIANELGKAQEFDNLKISTELIMQDINCVPSVAATENRRRLYLDLQQDPTDKSCTLHLWLLREWRDDFDPNNTKSSRNQVWVNTFTIGIESNNQTGSTTYFMGLGAKNDDHSQVEKAPLNEMEIFNTTGYDIFHGGMQRIVRVKLGKRVTGIDRPKRTSMFAVGDHKNGTFSSCWGIASKIDPKQQENRLPSCQKCRKFRLSQMGIMRTDENAANITITDCQDWNLFHPQFRFQCPNNYPTEYDKRPGPPSPPAHRPIFHQERIEPTQVSLQNSSRNQGQANTTKAFLRTCGCTNKLINLV